MIAVPQECFRPVINRGATIVPPHGLMYVYDVNDDGFSLVKEPTSSTPTELILVNGPGIIPVGFRGHGHRIWPATVSYDESTGETPANGETWGIGNGTWSLAKCFPGFIIVGGSAVGSVNALPHHRRFWARITDRDAVTCDTGSSGSQSGSNDTDYTYYVYSVHSVHAVDDGHGCPAWVNDEADVAIISEAAYEVNGNTVAVGTIVEVESVTYTDESLSGSEAESGSNSGSDNVGPAGCRLVFSHEGEPATRQCFTESVTHSTELDCDGNNYVLRTYETRFGPNEDGCWALTKYELSHFTTDWCCHSCDDTSGAIESGGAGGACGPCQDYYCLTFSVPSAPGGSLCNGYDGLKIELFRSPDICNNIYGITQWVGTNFNPFDPMDSEVPYVNAHLHRECVDGVYKWWIRSSEYGPCESARVVIHNQPTFAGVYLGSSSDPDTPPTTTGNMQMSLPGSANSSSDDCVECHGARYPGTWSLTVGRCDTDDPLSGSQSGSTHAGDCPCQWIWSTSIGPWTNIYASGLCGDPCLTTPAGNGSFAGEVRNTNCDGTTCDDGGTNPGPTCADCGTASRTATPSGGTGFLSTFTAAATLTYYAGTPQGVWRSAAHVPVTCGAQISAILFWCENNRWYCGIAGTGVAFEANAGGTCASMTFTMTFDGSNLLCPAMTGSVTITVTT